MTRLGDLKPLQELDTTIKHYNQLVKLQLRMKEWKEFYRQLLFKSDLIGYHHWSWMTYSFEDDYTTVDMMMDTIMNNKKLSVEEMESANHLWNRYQTREEAKNKEWILQKKN